MFGLILLCLSLTAFFLFLRFVIWYHLTVAFWILFSPRLPSYRLVELVPSLVTTPGG